MHHIKPMIESHPRAPQRDMDMIAAAVEALSACADSCQICADACLGEEMVRELVRCIRLCEDCSDVCATSGRMISRLTEPDGGLLRAQLEACITACRVCGDECEKHAGMHEHCRVCAESCRQAERAAQALVQTMR